jgi:putative DNA primase/helicase
MSAYVEEDRIRAALSHVPADTRDTWVQMGMAVKAELGDSGFDLWDTWSQASDAYSETDARAVWRSFKAGGITIATLFKEAIAHGYTESEPLKPLDPAESARRRATREREAQEAAEQHGRTQAEAAEKARDLWDRAGKVHADHAYVRAKKIKPFGAKQLREQLVIKIQDVDGAHHSTQYIQPDGCKTFQTGGRISGCFAAVTAGVKPNASTPLLIAEGFATACSLHEATGFPVAAAMNAGNLLNVAKAWRAKHPRVRIVICADDDTETAGNPGMTKALEAARAVGASLAVPDFGPDRPDRSSDFNDLHALDGLDALRRCVDAATAPGGVAKPAVIRPTAILTRASDIVPEAIRWLWPDWLPEGKLTLLAGSPGTGKTTLALALSATVSRGGKWPDGTVCNRTGDVLIWSGEDNPADTIVPRLMAAGADMDRVHIVTGRTNESGEIQPFDPSCDIPLLCERLAEMGGAAMLIVDPIVSAVAKDAHRANDVRRDLQALVDMAAGYQCAVLGITHLAKGTKGGTPAERVIGSGAFVALARMVLMAGQDETQERRVLVRVKSNIAPDDGGFTYVIEQTESNGIHASRVIWGEIIEGTARDILGDVEQVDEERGQRDEAKDFLVGLLSDGPVNAKDLKRDADQAGFSWSTIHRASSQLKVEKRKLGMKEGWEWALPKVSPPEDSTKISTLYTVKSSGGREIFRNHAGLRAVDFGSTAEDFTAQGVQSSESKAGETEDGI